MRKVVLIIVLLLLNPCYVFSESNFYYDITGQLSNVTSPSGASELVYDSNGNLVKKSKANTFFLNGDFENETVGWHLSSHMDIGNTDVKKGDKSLRFYSNMAINGEASATNLFTVSENTQYVLGSWIKDKTINGNFYVDFMEYDALDQMVYDGWNVQLSTKNEWEYNYVTFTTHPSTKKLAIRIVADGGVSGEAFVDGIQLQKDLSAFTYDNNFESGNPKWNLSPVMEISNVESKVGNASLHFKSNVPVNTGSETGKMAVKANSFYTLGAWIKDITATGNLYVDFIEYDALNQVVFDGWNVQLSSKGEWEYNYVTFQTHSTTQKIAVRVVADGGAIGEGFVDLITLTSGTPDTLYNSNFEEGTPKWSLSSTMAINQLESKDGSSSLVFESTSPVNSGSEGGKIAVSGNSTYTLSAWIKDGTTVGNFYVDFMEYDAANKVVFDGWNIQLSTKGEWEHKSVTFKTHEATAKIAIRVVADGGAKGLAYTDGIQLIRGVPNEEFLATFEKGTPKWNLSSVMFNTTKEAKDGFSSLQYYSNFPVQTASESGKFHVIENTKYKLDAWIKDKTTAGDFTIDFIEYDEWNNMVFDGWNIRAGIKGEWEHCEVTFLTHSNTKKIALRVIADGGAVGEAFADNIRLTKAP